jgi:hypothetical protein
MTLKQKILDQFNNVSQPIGCVYISEMIRFDSGNDDNFTQQDWVRLNASVSSQLSKFVKAGILEAVANPKGPRGGQLYKKVKGASKRLFIETDSNVDYGHLETLSRIFEKDYTKFDIVITDASIRVHELIDAIREADDIYVDSSLVYNPFGDGSTLFNALMKQALALGIEGKQVHFFRSLEGVNWGYLDMELVDKVFRKNFLYVENDNGDKYEWEQVDIDKLLHDYL